MNKAYIKGFDVLRGVFILLIFLSHSTGFSLVGCNSIWGAAGVTGFFILSGFLSNYRYNKQEHLFKECITSLSNFLKKFWPMYFFVTIVYGFVEPWSICDFVKAFFLSQSYWGSTETAMIFNGNTWFLSSLMFCYALSPILNRFVNESRNICLIISSFFCVAIHIIIACMWEDDFQTGYYWVYIFPATRMIDFYYGALLCRLKDRIVNVDSLVGIGFVGLYMMELLLIDDCPIALVKYDTAWVPLTMALIVFFYKYEYEKVVFLNYFKKLGKISFELFLFHRIIIIMVVKYNPHCLGFFFAFAIACILSYIMQKSDACIRKKIKQCL